MGANAVNGVINVITKRAQDTQGLLTSAVAGSQGQGMIQARYGGGTQQKKFNYRLYAKYFREGQSPGLDLAHPAYDAWSDITGGLRSDWQATPRDFLAFSANLYRASEQQFYLAPLLQPPFSQSLYTELKGTQENVMVNWEHSFPGGSLSTLQTYYDHLDRFYLLLGLQQQTFAVEFQHQLRSSQRHEVVIGAGCRLNQENIRSSDILSFPAGTASQNIFSTFLQDEITVSPARLWLTLGSKFESNPYTGWEAQPAIRVRWNPHRAHSLWTAVSRAVRIPSRYEEEARVKALVLPGPAGMPALVMVVGNQNLESEQLLAYELGYRTQPRASISFDAAAFYNVYKDIIGLQAGQPFVEPSPPHLVIPNPFANNLNARTKGLEFSLTYKPAAKWKLAGGYSWLQMRQTAPPGSTSLMLPGDNPRHQLNLRSYVTLPLGLEFDTAAFYTSALSAQDVPAYVALDARLGWRTEKHVEVSLVLQNLLNPRHPEFVQRYDVQGPTQVGRRIQGGITIRF